MADLYVYGVIGEDLWTGERSDELLLAQLATYEEDEELHLYINSGGGSMFMGLAMMHALRRHKGKVVAHIDGLAASAATLVALGADELHMPEGAFLMIHNPWTIEIGDHNDMRKAADDSEKFAQQMAAVYARKTGKDEEELRSAMDEETWLSAAEALAWGFADKVDEEEDEDALAMAFAMVDLSEFSDTPEEVVQLQRKGMQRVAAQVGKPGMTRGVPSGARNAKIFNEPKAMEPKASTGDKPNTQEPTMADDMKNQEPVQAPGLSARDIRTRCEGTGLPDSEVLSLVTDFSGKPEVEVQNAIISALKERSNSENVAPSIQGGVDARDKFRSEIMTGLGAINSQTNPNARKERNQYSGMSLLRIAEECVRASGGRPSVGDKRRLFNEAMNIQAALGSNSTSDFPIILRDTANAIMLRAFDEAVATWREWCVPQTLNDFKPHYMMDLSAFDNLPEVAEGGEYTYGTIGERGNEIRLANFAKRFRLTFEAIVNDQRDFFTRAPMKLGQAAARVPENLAYEVLTTNANIDGAALFSAGHGNTFNNALGYAGLDVVDTAMRNQSYTDSDGNSIPLDIIPAVLIVGNNNRVLATQLVGSQFESAALQVNVFGNAMRVVATPRLTGDMWYLAADPAIADTVAVGFLDGNEAPFMDEQPVFENDGYEWKVRYPCAAAAMSPKGLGRGGDGT